MLKLDQAAHTASVVAAVLPRHHVPLRVHGQRPGPARRQRLRRLGRGRRSCPSTGVGQAPSSTGVPVADMSYRAYVQPWVGMPLSPPSGAARAPAAGTTVYASWNGATQVARGGCSPDGRRVDAASQPRTTHRVRDLDYRSRAAPGSSRFRPLTPRDGSSGPPDLRSEPMTATRSPREDEEGRGARPRGRHPSSIAGSSCPGAAAAAAGLVAAGASATSCHTVPGLGMRRRRGLARRAVDATGTGRGRGRLQPAPEVPHPPGSAPARGRVTRSAPSRRPHRHPASSCWRPMNAVLGRRAPAGLDDDRPPRPIWCGSPRQGPQVNLDVQSYGGKPALTWWQGRWPTRTATGLGEIGDDTYHPVQPIHAGHGCRPTSTTSSSPPAGRALSPL